MTLEDTLKGVLDEYKKTVQNLKTSGNPAGITRLRPVTGHSSWTWISPPAAESRQRIALCQLNRYDKKALVSARNIWQKLLELSVAVMWYLGDDENVLRASC